MTSFKRRRKSNFEGLGAVGIRINVSLSVLLLFGASDSLYDV